MRDLIDVTDRDRASDEILIGEDVENGEGGSERDRIADVRAADGARMPGVHDLRPADHAGQR